MTLLKELDEHCRMLYHLLTLSPTTCDREWCQCRLYIIASGKLLVPLHLKLLLIMVCSVYRIDDTEGQCSNALLVCSACTYFFFSLFFVAHPIFALSFFVVSLPLNVNQIQGYTAAEIHICVLSTILPK